MRGMDFPGLVILCAGIVRQMRSAPSLIIQARRPDRVR